SILLVAAKILVLYRSCVVLMDGNRDVSHGIDRRYLALCLDATLPKEKPLLSFALQRLDEMASLRGSDLRPGDFHVDIQRSRRCSSHSGYRRFRSVLEFHQDPTRVGSTVASGRRSDD